MMQPTLKQARWRGLNEKATCCAKGLAMVCRNLQGWHGRCNGKVGVRLTPNRVWEGRPTIAVVVCASCSRRAAFFFFLNNGKGQAQTPIQHCAEKSAIHSSRVSERKARDRGRAVVDFHKGQQGPATQSARHVAFYAYCVEL